MEVALFIFIVSIIFYSIGYAQARRMRIEDYEDKIEEQADKYARWKDTYAQRLRETEASVRQQVKEQVELMFLGEKKWQDDSVNYYKPSKQEPHNNYPEDGWCNNCNNSYLDDEDRKKGCAGISGWCPIFNNEIEKAK